MNRREFLELVPVGVITASVPFSVRALDLFGEARAGRFGPPARLVQGRTYTNYVLISDDRPENLDALARVLTQDARRLLPPGRRISLSLHRAAGAADPFDETMLVAWRYPARPLTDPRVLGWVIV